MYKRTYVYNGQYNTEYLESKANPLLIYQATDRKSLMNGTKVGTFAKIVPTYITGKSMK